LWTQNLPEDAQQTIVRDIRRLKHRGATPSLIISEINNRYSAMFPGINLVSRQDLYTRSRLSLAEKMEDASNFHRECESTKKADPLFKYALLEDKSMSPPTLLGAIWATAKQQRMYHLCGGFLGWDTTHGKSLYGSLAGVGVGILPNWKTAIYFSYWVPAESNEAITWLAESAKGIYPDLDRKIKLHQSDRGGALVKNIVLQFPHGHLGTCMAPPHLRKGNLNKWRVSLQ
jgi:hypothetical protein